MKKSVLIEKTEVGENYPCYLVAEIGINHNGDIKLAKRLIDIAKDSHWDAVKFQKRTIDVVYAAEELAKPRESPFGLTNGDLKRGLEFGQKEYKEIDKYCKDKDMVWFASPWDEASVDFLMQFNIPCIKVASASITDLDLLRHIRAQRRPIIMSTGMSTLEEIDKAIEIVGTDDVILLHTCSTYPADYIDLNLRVMNTLKERYRIPVGYSGHETGIAPSVAAVAMGACLVERHVTLDRAMWGTDQAASLGPNGMIQLGRDIKLVEISMGVPDKRRLPSEIAVMKKLRRKGAVL